MNTTAEAARKTALDIRYGQVGLLQLKLRSTDPGLILDELTGKVATTPQFFRQTAICLDLAELEGEPACPKCAASSRRSAAAACWWRGFAEGPAIAELAKAMALPVITGLSAAECRSAHAGGQ